MSDISYYGCVTAVGYMGWQLVIAHHPVAGAWMIAGCVIGLVTGSWWSES